MAPIQFFINFLSFSAALFVIYWSKEGNLNQAIQYTFEHRKLNTSQLQADHLADIAYYYAVYAIAMSGLISIIRFVRGEFNQATTPDTKFVSNLSNVIVNSSEHFLIFVSIYVYLLQQKGLGLKVNSLLLFPSWFFLGRLGSLLEELLTTLTKNKFRFSYFGFTMTMVPLFFMIGQIFGYSPLKWF